MLWPFFTLFWIVSGFLAYGISKGRFLKACNGGEYRYKKSDERFCRMLFLCGMLGLNATIFLNIFISFCSFLSIFFSRERPEQPWAFCLRMPKELCAKEE